MKSVRQSPRDPGFVQDPYPFYARALENGPLHVWEDYAMPAAFSHAAVSAFFRDRRFGREIPAEMARETPAHLAPFQAVEAHSMLEAEGARHKRLRALVLRAFTSRQIAGLAEGIAALCDRLIADFPARPFDLMPAFCDAVPVITIARLLGVPEDMAPRLLDWSHRMVAMYMANKSRATEDGAAEAAAEFSAYLRDYIDFRRARPANDLLSALIAAEEAGDRLSTEELIATVILLLNAGHEATVHALGNAVKTLCSAGLDPAWLAEGAIAGTVEELLRFDPPLHMFTRFAYEDVSAFGHDFRRGDEVALLLAAANRDPAVHAGPHRFDPARKPAPHTSFGGGIHFCVGAPLARLEMQIALPRLFAHCPDLQIAEPPQYGDTYHFHGLERLMVVL